MNEYYKSDAEFLEAYGEAIREEWKAILDAGMLLQIDFPSLVAGAVQLPFGKSS